MNQRLGNIETAISKLLPDFEKRKARDWAMKVLIGGLLGTVATLATTLYYLFPIIQQFLEKGFP